MSVKSCKKCGKEKAHVEFYTYYSNGIEKLRASCKECTLKLKRANAEKRRKQELFQVEQLEKKRAKQRAHNEKYKEQRRLYAQRSKWKNKYGIVDLDAAQQLWDNHNGVCAICKRTDRAFVLDHCHTTNVPRDILCQHCNSLIGFANEDPAVLHAAIEYLSRFKPDGT